MTRSLRRHLSFANVVSMLALFVALGGTSYSAIKLTGKDVKNGSLTGKDVKNRSLGTRELSKKAVKSLSGKQGLKGDPGAAATASSIGSGNIIDNSLTTADIAGADVNGALISLSAGAVANGRCADFPVAIAGAKAGEAVVFSIKAAVPEGVLLYGARVPSDNTVTMKVCNLSGGTMAAIVDLPVRVITFG